ncbi:MAG: hypothetical protein Q4C48_11380 [Lachnospiraceae bacterium]|nr:hypothetical protein [Lachnospiraceae bacterium]
MSKILSGYTYRCDPAIGDYAETLAPKIQRFADVLEKELEKWRERK